MARHFTFEITDDSLAYSRNQESIDREAVTEGIHVVRTNVAQDALSAKDTVKAYKRLSRVERAFRISKTSEPKTRPIFHRLADRVRAHVLL